MGGVQTEKQSVLHLGGFLERLKKYETKSIFDQRSRLFSIFNAKPDLNLEWTLGNTVGSSLISSF